MNRLAFFTLVIFAALLVEPAFAWGPATHVGLGGTVLENLGLLPTAVAAILGRYGLAYLYGNIAADIVFAKRLSRNKQFCHHWSTAFRLLDSAPDERQRAFAYGYLSHLAADTVAHGKFVPRQIVISRHAVNLGHFYWELRADSAESDDTWGRLERVLRHDHLVHHEALASHITDTLLSYELNRRLFEGINTLAARRGFRRTMGAWNRRSRWPLPPALMQGYRSECVDRILSVLASGKRSALLREDPNGTSALMSVHVRRRELSRLRRRGVPIERRVAESSAAFAPANHLSGPPDASSAGDEQVESQVHNLIV